MRLYAIGEELNFPLKILQNHLVLIPSLILMYSVKTLTIDT